MGGEKRTPRSYTEPFHHLSQRHAGNFRLDYLIPITIPSGSGLYYLACKLSLLNEGI